MQPVRIAAVAATVVTACLTSVVPASAASATETIPSAGQAPRPTTDFVLVTLPNANVPNFQRRTVHCPTGMKVVGGGAEARGVNAILVGSFPTDDQRGWIGIGRQPGYNDVGISVFAICAR
ncbi:hypothetical protein AB0K60_26310 [Thermopolyspora sp. NPDC052614]|uniref:hypothetical protein n=1 Tax=Thermopolyspora sp. NPDC052614 TaxID=3155682 RepID=UPI00341A5462